MERLSPAPHPDRPSCPALPEASPLSNGNHHPETQPPPTYQTGIGCLSFDQLYHQTSRTVGYVMRQSLGMTNPEDIDDCMQSGYLKLWQKLQTHPDWLADKPKRYIVQAVVLRSKAQRFSHQRHYRKLAYDADAEQPRSHDLLTTRQVDTWIDLERALAHVAHQVEDQPAALLGLYCLITQATTQDVADTFGHGYSTLAKKKRQVKADLAALLDGYGLPPDKGRSANGHTAPHHRPASQHGLVTTRLLEAIHPPTERVIYLPSRSINVPRHRLEKRLSPDETYLTGWDGVRTLEQIINDPVVHRAAIAKISQLGLSGDDQADCIQQGFIRLWQKLCDDPNLLADKGQVWTGLYVAFSGNPKQFHRHNRRQQTFTHPDFDWQAADEYGRIGLWSGSQPTRAHWATEVDETLDIHRFLDTIFQRYRDDPKKQIALQAVTGVISSQEAAQQLGMNPKNFAAGIGNKVRQEVQVLLPEIFKETQRESWEAQLARGAGVDHITAIAQEVMHDPRLLLALYVVTTSASKKAVAETFGYGLTAFGNDIRTIKQMIATRYRSAAPT